MNQAELYFVIVTLSIGIGSGAGLSQRYGYIGFIIGLLGSLISCFLILSLFRRFSPKPKKSIRRKKNL